VTRGPADRSPLHVGIDATSWANDRGFGRFTRELIKALILRQTGFRYTLVFDQPPGEPVPVGAGMITAGTRRGLGESVTGTSSRSISYLWRMGRAVREASFDLFFFPTVFSYFPVFTRVPCVVCYHDTTAERLPELIFPTTLNRRLWQVKTLMARLQTTRAMTASQTSATDLEQILRIPADRIDMVTAAANPNFRVIDDPVVVADARAHCGVPKDAILLVYLGGMNRHKNVLRLLDAMSIIVSREPAVFLAVVGDTSGKGFADNVPELMHFVRSHPPLDRHVHFTGYLPDEVVAGLLNGAAALVVPSLWEGFGLPAVEAMSCGVPVLASRRGSLPEIIGNAGLFFEPDDARAIADCVLAFLGDKERQLALRTAAPKRAATFTWDRAAELAEICFCRCYEEGRR
jgi:glycosyltransferase involved in cell wall biosynthesis